MTTSPLMMEKYGIALILIGIVLVTIVIRIPIMGAINALIRRRQAKTVLAQRSRVTQPARVRQTDLEETLGRRERRLRAYAEQLARQGKVIDASRILETIGFQRQAVDLLEKNGFIDEAAAILIRLKVPHRAAVVFERNDRLLKAAQCYGIAGRHDKAGSVFLQLAAKDYRYYERAIEAFGLDRDVDSTLLCHARLMKIDKVVKTSFKENRIEFLADYMRDTSVAAEALRGMTEEQIHKLVASVPLSPSVVATFVVWSHVFPKPELTTAVFQRISESKDLSRVFWDRVTPEQRETLVSSLQTQAKQSVVLKQCSALLALGHYEIALTALKAVGAYREAAQGLLQQGKFSDCYDLLLEIDEPQIAAKVKEIMDASSGSPFRPEHIEQAKSLVSDVNPILKQSA